jgi:hypothetical protein
MVVVVLVPSVRTINGESKRCNAAL